MTALQRCESGMRRFIMDRPHDFGGVSGEGVVLEGMQFSVGTVVVHWLTPAPHGSIAVFDSFEDFMSVHVTSHPTNETQIKWMDE